MTFQCNGRYIEAAAGLKRSYVGYKETETAAARQYVPLEEYLRSSYPPDAEYMDGRIVERDITIGENDHSAWQKAIVVWFETQAARAGIRVRPELCVQVDTRNFLIPDVTLPDRSRPAEPIATYPPIAVFEVLFREGKLEPLAERAFVLDGS